MLLIIVIIFNIEWDNSLRVRSVPYIYTSTVLLIFVFGAALALYKIDFELVDILYHY